MTQETSLPKAAALILFGVLTAAVVLIAISGVGLAPPRGRYRRMHPHRTLSAVSEHKS